MATRRRHSQGREPCSVQQATKVANRGPQSSEWGVPYIVRKRQSIPCQYGLWVWYGMGLGMGMVWVLGKRLLYK